jgi:hypothetical protein
MKRLPVLILRTQETAAMPTNNLIILTPCNRSETRNPPSTCSHRRCDDVLLFLFLTFPGGKTLVDAPALKVFIGNIKMPVNYFKKHCFIRVDLFQA